jgi:ribulose-5-phosphate 4-epimerase/fuculose-1-phosphate aldolase
MTEPTALKTPPRFNQSEWQARLDLARLYRLAAHYGWTDLTATHFSARLPDQPDCYLLNSYDHMFDEITASNLVKMRFDTGEPAEGEARVNLAGHLIHTAVLNARPEINFVMHTHTRAGIAVSAMPGGLRPLSQHAGSILAAVAVHPYQDVTSAEDECELLARDLGGQYALLMENHGLLSVGRTAAEAFAYHYYIEMACKIQIDILSGTDSPIEIPPAALEPLMDWGRPRDTPIGGEYWPALVRLVDRRYPGVED